MSEDYEAIPELGVMSRLESMDLSNFSMLADEDDYNNFPEEEGKREEEAVDNLFKELGARPPGPPQPLPIWLTNRLRSNTVANFQNQVQSSQMQYRPGMVNMSKEHYHLEKLDPKHRVGFILMEFLPLWERDPCRAKGKGFFQWLDDMSYFQVYQLLLNIGDGDSMWATQNTRMFMKGVQYLDSISRRQYLVILSQRRNCMLYNGHPLSTAGLSTVFSGKGWGAWVLSGTNKFYTGPHIKGEFHHSSFLSGGMVKAAGEWKVEAGRLKTITGKTGHYQCPVQSLVDALLFLQQHIGLSGAYVNVWDKKTGKPTEFPAMTFISNKTMQDEYDSFGSGTLHTPVVEQRKPMIGTHRIK